MTAPRTIPTTESPRDVVGYAGGVLSASPATNSNAAACPPCPPVAVLRNSRAVEHRSGAGFLFAAMADACRALLGIAGVLPGTSRLSSSLCQLAGASAPALFLAGAVQADPSHHWGGSSATLRAGPGHPFAVVDCVNRLTGGHDSLLRFVLDLGGYPVAVTVWQGPGDQPDTYTVTPPPGFIAVPQVLTLDENTDGQVLIFVVDGVAS